jgi:trans-2-enoyl-CoA reductase
VANGFRAVVSGVAVRSVAFRLDGHSIRTVRAAPFEIVVRGAHGVHKLSARVSFTDGTRARSVGFRFRTCAPAARRVVRQPRFTG